MAELARPRPQALRQEPERRLQLPQIPLAERLIRLAAAPWVALLLRRAPLLPRPALARIRLGEPPEPIPLVEALRQKVALPHLLALTRSVAARLPPSPLLAALLLLLAPIPSVVRRQPKPRLIQRLRRVLIPSVVRRLPIRRCLRKVMQKS